MPSFLRQVAQDILQKHPTLEGVTLILPSRRAGVFLKKELSKLIDKPTWSPKIITIEDFVLELEGLKVADTPSLIFSLYECYKDSSLEHKESFADFSKWVHLLLADFNEVDRYMVNAQSIFSYLADVERIKRWNLEIDQPLTEMVENYLKLWEALPDLYANFSAKTLKEERVYQGLAYRKAAENIHGHLEQVNKEYQNMFFIGFSALNKAEEQIMLALYEEGLAHFYWDVDRYYYSDLQHEAGKFLRESRLIKKLREKGDFHWFSENLKTTTKSIEVVNASGNHLQAVAAHEAIRDFREQALENVALVMADENMLQPFLNNLSEDIGHLNITMGLPLKVSTVSGFFQLLIEMQLENEQTQRKDGRGNPAFHYQKWDDLLGHSGMKGFGGKTRELEGLREKIRTQNQIYLSWDELLELGEKAKDIHLEAILGNQLSPSELYQALAELTEKMHQHLESQTAMVQMLFAFYKLFNILSELFHTYPYVEDVKTSYQFYREMLASETLDLYGEPLSGLQVMGMLETRLLDFNNLVITSLNEDVLPKGRSATSLIPFDIKREFGLPTFLDKDAVFAYHFYRLLQRAENITLIYSSKAEGLGAGEPSRFITQLKYELLKSNPKISWKERIIGGDVHINNSEEQEIEKTPAVMERLHKMAEDGISPSALIDYINHPLEFYYKRVLNLREADEVEEVAGFDTQGTLVHSLLESLYSVPSEDGSRPIDSLKAEFEVFDLSIQTIRNDVANRLKEQFGIRSANSGKNLLIREILAGMVFNFLKKEKQEIWKVGELQLLGLEERLETEVKIKNNRTVKIRGVVDRIDQTGETIRVIDYKTGFVTPYELKFESFEELLDPKDKNKAFQLLMYAFLFLQNSNKHKEVLPCIISLRNLNNWPMPLKAMGSNAVDKGLLLDFEHFLTSLLEEIFDQNFPFRSKEIKFEGA